MTEILDISNLKKAIDSLKESIKDYKITENIKMKEYIQDSCIKRFEYTVETSWKLMKKYLKLFYGKSEQELTMNNIFRYMQGYGFIKSWEKWSEYYSKRNDTSHEYNKEKADDVLNYISDFIIDAEFLYKNLLQSIKDNK